MSAQPKREGRSRRRVPVQSTRLPQPTDEQEREAERAWRERMATPAYRIEQVRVKALTLSALAGDVLRGEADEGELCVAEDDVMRAIIARRGT